MVVFNLFPIGALQFYDALANGYWHARSPEFYQQPIINFLEWLRLPGDAVFIIFGILPLVYLAFRMVKHRHRPDLVPPGDRTELLTEAT